MAAVSITIKDADKNNIAVDVNFAPQFPTSKLMYTNAQMVAVEVLALLQRIANEINNRQHINAVNESVKLTP